MSNYRTKCQVVFNAASFPLTSHKIVINTAINKANLKTWQHDQFFFCQALGAGFLHPEAIATRNEGNYCKMVCGLGIGTDIAI